jgi:hypothetical protein
MSTAAQSGKAAKDLTSKGAVPSALVAKAAEFHSEEQSEEESPFDFPSSTRVLMTGGHDSSGADLLFETGGFGPPGVPSSHHHLPTFRNVSNLYESLPLRNNPN